MALRCATSNLTDRLVAVSEAHVLSKPLFGYWAGIRPVWIE